jgi:uncharacterized protein YgiB involved in biofilm formation
MGLTGEVCFHFFYTPVCKDNAVSNHFWIPSNVAFLLPQLVKQVKDCQEETLC